jgi:hypothetical protein
MSEKKLRTDFVLYLSMLNGYIIFTNFKEEEKFYLDHIKPFSNHYVYYQFADSYKRLPFSMIMSRENDAVQQTRILDAVADDSMHIQNCRAPKLSYEYICFRLTTGAYQDIQWSKFLPELFYDV